MTITVCEKNQFNMMLALSVKFVRNSEIRSQANIFPKNSSEIPAENANSIEFANSKSIYFNSLILSYYNFILC